MTADGRSTGKIVYGYVVRIETTTLSGGVHPPVIARGESRTAKLIRRHNVSVVNTALHLIGIAAGE
jgi:hypothetical protein